MLYCVVSDNRVFSHSSVTKKYNENLKATMPIADYDGSGGECGIFKLFG